MNHESGSGSTHPTVLLNWGLGKHSTAAAVELIENPARRDFRLEQLILVTAMTGDEWRSSRRQAENFLLPLLRAHRIRYVQIARNGSSERDGITVISDSREPYEVFTDGVYRLSDETLRDGVVPSVCKRTCSQKFKGWVIGRWIAEHLSGGVRQIIGFHSGEAYRIERESRFYAGEGSPIEHPLFAWGWDDEACVGYLRERFGVKWENSACDFCMFAGGKPEVIARYRREPASAVKAVIVERTARAINPRISLFSRKLVEDLLRADGNPAVAEAHRLLDAGDWSLMRVRRIKYSAQNTHRSTEALARGSKPTMSERLEAYALHARLPLTYEGDHPRLYLHRMPDPVAYPAAEELVTIAPGTIRDKARPNFDSRWRRVVKQGNFLHTASLAAA